MATHGLVVAFICAHCPYVLHLDEHMANAAQRIERGMGFVAISSNDVVNYPQDHHRLKGQAINRGFQFLISMMKIKRAKAFGAVCTPDFFVYDDGFDLQGDKQL